MTGGDWVAMAGIAGTLGGTLAGYGLSLWTEKRRWAREDRHRHAEERRRAYSELMEAAAVIARARALGEDLRTDFERVVSAMTRIDLVASTKVRECLSIFSETFVEYMRTERGDSGAGVELMKAARAFCDETRRELGVEEAPKGKADDS